MPGSKQREKKELRTHVKSVLKSPNLNTPWKKSLNFSNKSYKLPDRKNNEFLGIILHPSPPSPVITEQHRPGNIDRDSGKREHWVKNFLPRSAIIMLVQKNRLVDTQC